MDKKATGKKILRILGTVLLVLVGVIAFLALTGTVAHAAGLVDDTVNGSNLYSKYPLSNYQLDFYVELVNQYLTVNAVSGELAQKVMNEALKYQGWTYVFGGSNPNTSF